MNKDIIYVDIEDDITDVISKIKSSKESVVALVPPKRVGVLQSSVNLKLLAKTGRELSKNIVLISNNSALSSLAAVAKLPVAKTLQSRPEVPDVAILDIEDTSDVIDGEEPTTSIKINQPNNDSNDTIDDEILIDSIPLEDKSDDKSKKSKSKSKKVPNFDKFRKKVLIIGGIAIFVVGFLVWALVFAPAATVTVIAKTSSMSFSENITGVTDASAASPESGVFALEEKKIDKVSEVTFEPTGTKDVGEKAKGTMRLTRTSVSNIAISIPAGTTFSAGQLTYVSTKAATLEGATVGANGLVFPTITIDVEAAEIGEEYNVAAGAYASSVGGYTSAGSAMAGGSKKQVKVVSQEDVDKAKEKLAPIDESSARSELSSSFGDSYIIITASMSVKSEDPASSPAINEETSASSAKLTAKTEFKAYGIKKSDIKIYMDKVLEVKIADQGDQKIYDSGVDKAFIDSYLSQSEDKITGKLKSTASVGPEIDAKDIKELVKGKRFGEIQTKLQSINGVKDVSVKFSFFWVNTVPNNDNKVTVNIELDE